jgi:hypothetical protein
LLGKSRGWVVQTALPGLSWAVGMAVRPFKSIPGPVKVFWSKGTWALGIVQQMTSLGLTSARLVLGGPLCRRALVVAITTRSAQVSWQAALRDLLKIAILRRLYRGEVPDELPFGIHFHTDPETVRLLSLPGKRSGAREAGAAVDWASLEKRMQSAAIREIVWDHSWVRADVCYQRGLTRHADLCLPGGRRYRFKALLALAAVDAGLVVSLLRHALGADEDSATVGYRDPSAPVPAADTPSEPVRHEAEAPAEAPRGSPTRS